MLGARSRAGQCKTWINRITQDLNKMNSEMEEINNIVRDGKDWRHHIDLK